MAPIPEDEITVSGCYSEYHNGVPRHWLVKFHPTDAGRSTSKRPRQHNDCTVVAIALACDMPYDAAYDLMAECGRTCSRGFHMHDLEKGIAAAILESRTGKRLQWKSFPAVKGQSRMNPAKFCEDFQNGRYIVKTAKHVIAIIDGIVLDTKSPRPDRCVYGAWEVT